MKRREFVRTAAAGASAGLVLASCGNAATEAPAVQTGGPRLRWRLASSFSRSLDTIYRAAEVLANRVSLLTGGRFEIQIYPGGELVPAFSVLDSVQKATIQIGHTASYYYLGKNPALVFDCTVPFGLSARQFNAWMYHGNGLDLTRGVLSDFGVLNFPGGNTGVQMGGWFKRELRSMADLKGLRMRIPGLGGRVMEALDVTVQQIPGGEIYPALDRGTIDAAEWVGPYDDEKLGFADVASNYYYPGWWEPGANLSFYINESAWSELPANYQEALDVAAKEASLDMLARYDALNPPAFDRLVAGGTSFHVFPEDIMNAAAEISEELVREPATEPAYAAILDDYLAWRDLSNRWSATAEWSYATLAFRRMITDNTPGA